MQLFLRPYVSLYATKPEMNNSVRIAQSGPPVCALYSGDVIDIVVHNQVPMTGPGAEPKNWSTVNQQDETQTSITALYYI